MPLTWTDPRHRVVGVVEDSRWLTLTGQERPMFYRSFWDGGVEPPPELGITLFVRSALPFETLRHAVESALKAVAPGLPIRAWSMTQNVEASISEQRLFASVVGLLTVLAIVLAGIGSYALVAFSVAQRTRELGIRMALGAEVGEILKLVLRQGATLALIGVPLGLLGAVGLSQLIASRLFGVSPVEPALYLGAAGLLGLIVLVACLAPARSASRIDPIIALRAE